ncbi:MAG: response regulator [Chloroflexi bacterium]|nr:response regulator [Chloroflexota bacterium]
MKTILVIEDEDLIRLNLMDLLDAENYNVISATDGAQGVQLARDHHPDLIVCDIMMPELDGYGVLAELRGDAATASIPFIFLSARAEQADRQRGIELGADDYLTKPFTRRELLDAIQSCFAKQDAV